MTNTTNLPKLTYLDDLASLSTEIYNDSRIPVLTKKEVTEHILQAFHLLKDYAEEIKC